jgi:hypothetical protein
VVVVVVEKLSNIEQFFSLKFDFSIKIEIYKGNVVGMLLLILLEKALNLMKVID